VSTSPTTDPEPPEEFDIVTIPQQTMIKLLTAAQAQSIARDGATALVGHVVPASELESFTDPAVLRQTFGVEEDRRYDDPEGAAYVLRFPVEELQRFTTPGRRRPIDRTYPTGFLPGGGIVPVSWIEYTRVPIGSTAWRLRAGTTPEGVAVYRSLAQGWQGVQGYPRPEGLEGPRASWRGLDLPAALTNDDVELVSFEEQHGMVQAPTGVWQAVLPRSELEAVFEIVLTTTWRDTPARVLRSNGDQVLLLLETDRDTATTIGATEVEPDVFQVVTSRAEIGTVSGLRNELVA